MRKVDLTKVPRKINKGKEIYLWSEAIGADIPFEYDGHAGSFKILSIDSDDREYMTVLYNNKTYTLLTRFVKKNKIDKLFDKEIKWVYNIGDNIKDQICTHKRDLTITNRKWDNTLRKSRNNKWYQYQCNICGYNSETDDTWINEDYLKNRGQGCSCCSGVKVIKGINDVATTAPWIVKYFVNIEDAYTHTKTSSKKVLMRCPICGKTKMIPINRLYTQGFSCPICGDGISFPEKVFMSLLDQLHIKYKWQLNKTDFEWCDKYRYDFYLIDYNYIVETHGMQHYELRIGSKFGSLEEIQRNDAIKIELAANNNIDEYIVLDCRYSRLDWILNSIENSILKDIIDLSNVDFDAIEKYINGSLFKEVCDTYKERHPEITTEILANEFGISRGCVTKYLKKGTKIGLCNYEDVKTGAKERGNKSSNPLKVTSDNNTYYFRSIKLLNQKYNEIFRKKMTQKCVFSVLKGEREAYDNMKFEKISKEEFNKAFDENKNVYGEKFILSIT